jgi:hypothetical protein
MSRRLAYRPRYHNTRYLAQPPLPSRKTYLRTRWTYRRRQPAPFQRRSPAQAILALPWGYQLSWHPFGR